VLSLIAALLATGALWSVILRNDVTPGGDGRRIMKFIEFARNSTQGFAFWNPFRNGGYPLLGDPEHFWLFAQLVDPSSPKANLELNAIFFVLILISVVPAWLIGRKLGLTQFWNFLFIVSLCITEHFVETQLSGRVAGFVSHTALLFVIWVLLYERMRPWHVAALVISIGVLFTVSAYYALIPCLLVLSAFLFRDGFPWKRSLRWLWSTVVRASIIVITGFLLSSVWSVPLLAHFMMSYVSPAMLHYPPNVAPSVFSYGQMFVPFFPAGVDIPGTFISLILLPAVALYRLWEPKPDLPGLLGFHLVYLWAAVFMAMSLPAIGPLLANAYSVTLIVSGIRWFLPFQDVLQTVFLVNAIAIFQQFQYRPVSNLDRPTRLFLAAFFLLSTILMLVHTHFEEKWTIIAAAMLLAVAAYSIASTIDRFTVTLLEHFQMRSVAVFLIGLSALCVMPRVELSTFPGTDIPTHVDNKPEWPQLDEIVRSDREAYFRFISDTVSDLSLEAQKRGTVDFSLFFPRSLAYTLSYLSKDHNINQLRPHWVKLKACGKFDSRALDLLAVKYMFCSAAVRSMTTGWDLVAQERNVSLFRRATYDGGIRLFCNWLIAPSSSPTNARETVLSAFADGVALIAPEGASVLPDHDSACPNGRSLAANVTLTEHRPGSMSMAVTSSHPGVIVIPDNFDSGWHAWVNGRYTPVLKVYDAYLGIPVQAGQNTIRLAYRDVYFWFGFAMSVAVLLGLLIYLLLSYLRRSELRSDSYH
jgi:hypothetical protein